MREKKNAVVWTHLCWVGCMRQKCTPTATATATATTEQNKKYTTEHETVAAINGTWEMSSRYSWAEQFTRRNVYHITSHLITYLGILFYFMHICTEILRWHTRERIYYGRWKISVHYNATIILGQIDFSAIPFERLCILCMWQCIHICSVCNTVVGCYHTISLFD